MKTNIDPAKIKSIKSNTPITVTSNDENGIALTADSFIFEYAELEQTQNNSGKQEEIKELEAQVSELKAERNALLKSNLELQTAFNELLEYTKMFVGVEVEE